MKGIRKLEDWITLPEAGELLGISRQGFHKLMMNGVIHVDDIRTIGDKPTYVVRTATVKLLKELRKQTAAHKKDMTSVLQEAIEFL